MLANPFLDQTVIAVFAGLLLAVAVADVRRYEIPNRCTAAIALLYPLHVLTAATAVNWSGGLIVGGVALLVGFLAYAMRFTGGGDAKFFAAVALWAGPDCIVLLTFVTALVGGVVGFALLVRRRLTAPAKPRSTVPLAARIGAAVNVFFGNVLLARVGHANAAASTPVARVETGGPDAMPASVPPASVPPVGSLPYGVAICAGGLVIAAILFMRG